MKRILPLISAVILTLSFNSCKKVEGPGGSSSITGKINVQMWDGAGSMNYDYDGADEDVYIIYGEGNTTHNDKIETSYDGTFSFDYLENGTYQVFVYEEQNTGPNGEKNVLLFDVEITEKKSTTDLGTINVKDYL
jgi:hypothetical protein